MTIGIESFINEHLVSLEGWCAKDKAKKLYDTIREIKPKLCVEIGVFGGSSFFPQALALKHNNKGLIVGIDPWNTQTAIEEMESKENKDWWSQVDLDGIYNGFISKISTYGVENFCKIYKEKSENCVKNFQDFSIDVLHIDGNHAEKLAYQDSVQYYPKVKIGGYIFFDDTTWKNNSKTISTEKGMNYLLQYCQKICIVGKDCLMMKKIR